MAHFRAITLGHPLRPLALAGPDAQSRRRPPRDQQQCRGKLEENKIRPAALGRKNWLFCGSDAGGTRAAAFYTLIGNARMNGIEPHAWLTDVIARIGAHPIHRLAELLPWSWQATQSVGA